MVDRYHEDGLPGRFEMRPRGKGFSVISIAEQVNRQGNIESVETTPVLDTRISLRAEKMSGAKALAAIVDAVNAAGGRETLKLGVVPLNLFANKTALLSASNEPVRIVLDRLFQEMKWTDSRTDSANPQVTWRLFRDTIHERFVLNLRIAEKLTRGRNGAPVRVPQ